MKTAKTERLLEVVRVGLSENKQALSPIITGELASTARASITQKMLPVVIDMLRSSKTGDVSPEFS